MVEQFNINDIVVSSRFGFGQVTGFETIGPNADRFIVINSLDNNLKTLVSAKDSSLMRKLATSDEVDGYLCEVSKKDVELPNFEDRKTRITYFKEAAQQANIDDTVDTLLQLKKLEDRGSVENKILENIILLLSREIHMVKKMEIDECKRVLEEHLGMAS